LPTLQIASTIVNIYHLVGWVSNPPLHGTGEGKGVPFSLLHKSLSLRERARVRAKGEDYFHPYGRLGGRNRGNDIHRKATR